MNLVKQFLEQAQSLKSPIFDKWIERESQKDTFESDLDLEIDKVSAQHPELSPDELKAKATQNLFDSVFNEVLNHLESELTTQEKEGNLEVYRSLNLSGEDVENFVDFLEGKAMSFQQYAGLGSAWTYKKSTEDFNFVDNKKESVRIVLKGKITVNNIDVQSTVLKNLISLYDQNLTLIDQSELELLAVLSKHPGSPEILEYPINQSLKV